MGEKVSEVPNDAVRNSSDAGEKKKKKKKKTLEKESDQRAAPEGKEHQVMATAAEDSREEPGDRLERTAKRKWKRTVEETTEITDNGPPPDSEPSRPGKGDILSDGAAVRQRKSGRRKQDKVVESVGAVTVCSSCDVEAGESRSVAENGDSEEIPPRRKKGRRKRVSSGAEETAAVYDDGPGDRLDPELPPAKKHKKKHKHNCAVGDVAA